MKIQFYKKNSAKSKNQMIDKNTLDFLAGNEYNKNIRSVNKMFALGLFLGFIAGIVFLAVASCIFVESEDKNNRKW